MYGETPRRVNAYAIVRGLSPHVRGNPARWALVPGSVGSIPACTGKPENAIGYKGSYRVYPRMYGETHDVGGRVSLWWGLSPHVRGNQLVACKRDWPDGSIPACTGKPHRARHSPALDQVYPRMYGKPPSAPTHPAAQEVYPRMYGETDGLPVLPDGYLGLSPHVRGNPCAGLRTR